ncbi:hypothetical protein BH11PSE3_BH11PSE3_27030 [soil metagenome]
MKLNWLNMIALGALAGACADPNPPPPNAVPGQTQTSAPGMPAGPMTDNMPPSAIDANPPGTPSYVIAPGDPTGRRNSQIPRPGGAPAF